MPQGLEAGRGFGLVSYSLHSPKSVAKKKKKWGKQAKCPHRDAAISQKEHPSP